MEDHRHLLMHISRSCEIFLGFFSFSFAGSSRNLKQVYSNYSVSFSLSPRIIKERHMAVEEHGKASKISSAEERKLCLRNKEHRSAAIILCIMVGFGFEFKFSLLFGEK